MTDIFLKLQQHLDSGLPFAVYAKPGSTTLTAVFQTTDTLHSVGDFSRKGFVMAPFADGDTIFIPYEEADVMVADIPETSISNAETKATTINQESKDNFENLVNECITAIKAGNFEKLVASRKEAVPVTLGITQIFERLLNTYPTAFRYCFYSKATGLWMGATPEQLLKAENNTLHTVALAGTQLYNSTEDAVWPDKEKQEQLFVTEYITNQLEQFSSRIDKTAPYTFRAGNIVHIKTDISAEIDKSTDFKDIITTLHPTPAVCGLPKNEAKTFLLKHEGYNREYYSGYLGELNHNFASQQPETDLFVNLRCMKIEGNTAHLYIGCGITKDSDPEKEFIETVNKSMTMKRLF